MRPRIGVTGPDRGGGIAWWCTALALRRAGAKPVRITPNRIVMLGKLDGFVIGGGADVGGPDPRDIARDRLELDVLAHASHRGRPVLGICRGAQLMNVHGGGTLLRDLAPLYPEGPSRYSALACKTVALEPDSCLAEVTERRMLEINSLHRQAVDIPGADLRIVAREANGVVQAIEHRRRPMWIGVQWHPEYLQYRAPHQELFRALAEAAAVTPFTVVAGTAPRSRRAA